MVKSLEPHNLKGLAPAKLKELKLTEILINKREEEIFIGSETREIFDVADDDTKRVKENYLKAGKTLLRKLPLDNITLEAISFLNLDKRGKSGCLTCLTKIVIIFRHTLNEEEQIAVHEELRIFIAMSVFLFWEKVVWIYGGHNRT